MTSYKDMFTPNEEWWNPPPWSKALREQLDLFPVKFFEDYNEETRRTMCLYLRWCNATGHKPKYMHENTVKILCETLPYIVKIDTGRKHIGKLEKFEYLYPRDPNHTKLVNGAGRYANGQINFKILLTRQVLKYWLHEATEWEKALAVDEVNGPGDLRDAMYRVSTALTSAIASRDASIILYVSGWVDEIKRTLDQHATTHHS